MKITTIASAAAILLSMSACAAPQNGPSYALVPDEHGMVLKTPDGRTVFRYMTKKPAGTRLTAESACCLYPLNTPSGEGVVDFAPDDHRHHRGLFLAWHSMTGRVKADFWGWGEWAPKEGRVITNRSVRLVEADGRRARLEVANQWKAGGRAVIDEHTEICVREEEKSFVIDLDFRLTPQGDVTIDRTAFGGLCAKARKDGAGVYTGPSGAVKLPPPHHLRPESDWPAADWYDFSTTLKDGRTVGIAILDHPANPPTLWHNLAAISMVNPCIAAPGPVELKAGRTLRLRYRLAVHDGPAPVEQIRALSEDWKRR